VIDAERVLVATNAASLRLAGEIFAARKSAEPKLTFAIATAPMSKKKLAEIGLGRQPFYTEDLPYLWGRQMKNRRLIFGSGLVPGWGQPAPGRSGTRRPSNKAEPVWHGLEQVDVRRGEAAERLRALEKRVRGLHPGLKKVRVTHRWGGPILLTKDFLPVFRTHPKSNRIVVLGGYSGHGVALSVYLGKWAADHLAGRRELPKRR
jgi:glycine/D-amino acid oxidase-like deaminating enzyme